MGRSLIQDQTRILPTTPPPGWADPGLWELLTCHQRGASYVQLGRERGISWMRARSLVYRAVVECRRLGLW